MMMMQSMWDECALGDVCTFRAGSAFSRNRQGKMSGDFPFIKVSDMNLYGNEIHISTANNWVDAQDLKSLRANPLPEGTPIFAKIGEALKHNRVRILSRPTIVDNNMMGAVADKAKIDPRFLYYWLCNTDVAALSGGTSVPYLTVAVLSRVPICRPPLDEQRQIASILAAYDDLIENNTRRIAIVEEMARALYQEWFVHFRFPGHEHVPLVNSSLGPVPEGWEVGELQDALVLQRGFDLPLKEREAGPIAVYASTGIVGTHSEVKVRGPGVVTGRSGSLGTVIYCPKDFWPLNTTLWVKEFRRSTPFYAFYLLQGLGLEKYDGGAAVPTLNRNHVHGLPTVLPPLSLLEQFDEVLSPMYDLRFVLDAKNQNLGTTRDLLLPKLISGEIDVSALGEAPIAEAAD